jgi:adenine-specific DNA-methyltransferase
VHGYFTEAFCVESQFFQPKNGSRIDAIREAIGDRQLDPDIRAVLLTSLMEAADRVDSTCGVQMAYLKQWAPRSYNDLQLRLPNILSGPGLAVQGDAEVVASNYPVDIAYLDPPYNQHSYRGNYHIWETLVRWDNPPRYGKARKRIDCKQYQSSFNSRSRIEGALRTTLHSLDAKHIVISFNNEGYLTREQLIDVASEVGYVAVFEFDSKRYVGAQIGIYNPTGIKVGKVSHLRNSEYLFVVSKNQEALRRAELAMRVHVEGSVKQLDLL